MNVFCCFNKDCILTSIFSFSLTVLCLVFFCFVLFNLLEFKKFKWCFTILLLGFNICLQIQNRCVFSHVFAHTHLPVHIVYTHTHRHTYIHIFLYIYKRKNSWPPFSSHVVIHYVVSSYLVEVIKQQ